MLFARSPLRNSSRRPRRSLHDFFELARHAASFFFEEALHLTFDGGFLVTTNRGELLDDALPATNPRQVLLGRFVDSVFDGVEPVRVLLAQILENFAIILRPVAWRLPGKIRAHGRDKEDVFFPNLDFAPVRRSSLQHLDGALWQAVSAVVYGASKIPGVSSGYVEKGTVEPAREK